MPRQARQMSSTGIYHLIVRGINREVIFQDDNDRQRYIATLARIATDSNATVLGYCLMDNHVHVLIKEGLTSISKLMHRLGASYAHYYNARYERVGHVFQNRFKSENIENDNYLLSVIRYIHQNPVTAELVSSPEQWEWSNYLEWVGLRDAQLCDFEIIRSYYDDESSYSEMMDVIASEKQIKSYMLD